MEPLLSRKAFLMNSNSLCGRLLASFLEKTVEGVVSEIIKSFSSITSLSIKIMVFSMIFSNSRTLPGK